MIINNCDFCSNVVAFSLLILIFGKVVRLPMLRKTTLTAILFLLLCTYARAQKGFVFAGTVLDDATGGPVEFATVVLERTEQWGVADLQGKFSINNVPAGKNTVTISCLGYATWTREIQITKDITNFKITLKADNLALEGAVVTAQEDGNSATTSRTIDKTALEHVQLMNVSDISSLLPGGATSRDQALTSEQQFNVRAAAGENGNASFGTAVEVDGVRISNNASFATASTGNPGLKGVNTNNIASSNVESVEVITGVPSVEYGDIGSAVVKVNTKKGKTPWMVTMSTSPNTKQLSASKGFGLGSNVKGESRGVLNASAEYTTSFSKAMSPYTAYDRKQMSLNYFNTISSGLFADFPLRINFGLTGNLGGMNTQADPDAIQGTWAIGRDDAIRGNFSFSWLLSRKWITNVELTASLSYSDKSTKERTYNSSATNKVVLHGKEAGYYMAEPYSEPTPAVSYIDPGYWYNIMCDDDRPISAHVTLKTNWSARIAKASNKLKTGVDWSSDYNYGRGIYSPEMATAPTFREYPYYEIPVMNNIAVYAEDNLMLPIGSGRLNLIAGLRNDNTYIKGSAYGLTSSLSPRFNAKYNILSPQGRRKKAVRELALRASWGIAVKLPSFSVLFPIPTYKSDRVFASTTNSFNQSFEAYRIEPRIVEYNPTLRWQRNRICEVCIESNLFGCKVSLAAFWNRTYDTYRLSANYSPNIYTYTSSESLSDIAIPADDRAFSIDKHTGVVTVSDKNGILPSQVLASQTWREMSLSYIPDNENSPVDRYGLEWVVDLPPLKAISTKLRLDGTWYTYHYLASNTVAYVPSSYRSAQDGLPYTYVGYYYGNNATSNGSESQTLRTNLTITTHIPSVRMIFSAKLEASLLKYSRSLSETMNGEELAKVISNISDKLSTTGESIYAGDNYVVLYPRYYSTHNDPTLREYLPDLLAARESGNTKLYTDLSYLAYSTSYLYTFVDDYFSPFFSANFSVTKEIGELASVSFYANNFFNNRAQVWSSKSRTYYSVANYIPKYYYGLTLRLKF